MILTLGTTPAVARVMQFGKLTLDEVNRAASVQVSAAGKAVNVARVVKALGHQVTCCGVVGGDTGQTLERDLQSLGVGCAFVPVTPPTRVCITIIDHDAGQTTELVEEASPVDPSIAELLLTTVRHYAERASVLVCAGTIAPGIPDSFYHDAVLAARSINPNIIAIIDAKGSALTKSLAAGVIVKCNRAEIGDSIDNTLARGARAVIVTDGANPTIVADRNSQWTIASPKINVISPIGSGDSLAAGLAVGLASGHSIDQAACLGVACAATNAESAIAGDVSLNRVDALMKTISVEKHR